MELGERIRQRREELGLTQKQLAGTLGVTPQHISVIEQGRRAPSIPTLVRLAKELGVTVDYLAAGEESVVSDSISVIKADAMLDLNAKRALVTLVEQLRSTTPRRTAK